MNASVFKLKNQIGNKIFPLLAMGLSLFLAISVLFLLEIFYQRAAREVVGSWHNDEVVNLQQGNVLSSFTKLQRGLAQSNLLRGAIALDENGHVLAQIGQTQSTDFVGARDKEIGEKQLGLFSSVFYINAQKVRILIFTGAPILLLVLVALIFYFIGLVFVFGFSFRRLLMKQEAMKAEIQMKDLKTKLVFTEAVGAVAQQVAHDIRSPLSALNMVSSSLIDVSEEKRLLIRNAIQRINDIANDLLAKGKQAADQLDLKSSFGPSPESNLAQNQEVILLPALVDSLVSEKRIQYRDQINVQIQSDFKDSFGAFVIGNGKELMRLLSNLINNSVEAFTDKKGEVTVSIRLYKDRVHLSIRDNGRGIPPEVLLKLGEAGVTHGKEGFGSGNGLGVYHAKKTIESAGGRLEINSQVEMGTMIEIHLPRIGSPAWFLDKILLKSGMEILSLDDDLTIHQIWKGRLDSLQATQKNIFLRNFTSAREFKSLVKSLPEGSIQNKYFLIDYELLAQATTGLDVIEELGLRENVVLVTSRYEEPEIKRRCELLKIKLLPKSLSGFVPMILE